MSIVSNITGERVVPVLYLDIDGTVRYGKDELGRFVNGPKDVRLFNEVPALLMRYKRAGWRIIGVSNQGGIALGYQSKDDCVKAMRKTQRLSGNAFDRLVWCAHHPDATDPEMSVCWCRKPRPGLLIEAALLLSEHTGEVYPPHLALMVGDRPEDEQCAANAGIGFMDAAAWRTGDHLRAVTG